MAVYVNRIVKVAQTLPLPPGDDILNLNCLNFFTNNVAYNIPLYELTPYYLKDSEGHIFENIWQGSKCYQSVDAQHEVKANKVIWSHPAETHIIDGKITPQFWAWRAKLWNNPYAVRYPNGYYGRHKCLCALWYDNGKWETLQYVPARKKIYCKVYCTLVQNTTAYKMLKELHDKGHSLQICEMDVRPGLITEDVLRTELNNDKQPFGHGYVLSACLLGLTHIFDE